MLEYIVTNDNVYVDIQSENIYISYIFKHKSIYGLQFYSEIIINIFL